MDIYMSIEIIREPVPVIIFHDFFPPEINEKILNEAIKNSEHFTESSIGDGKNKEYRNNLVCYYDNLYQQDRSKSFLLSALDGKFRNDKDFREILSTCPYPICDFLMTTKHESQVSRYGDLEHYNWHQDRFANTIRHITLVYYFHKEPKQWSGGEISFTDSPAYNGILVEKDPQIRTLIPENNMAVVFSSTALHRVHQTRSPKDFASGRFSANVWIGY